MKNPYREGIWDGSSKEVEMDDRYKGWNAGYCNLSIRACRSKAYTEGLAEGSSARESDFKHLRMEREGVTQQDIAETMPPRFPEFR
jgi:hypothetical protein